MDGPKFNLVEVILGSMVALLIDIVSIFADLLAGIGGFVIQTLSWLLFTLWFTLKGATATANLMRRFLVPIGAQIVPFIPTQIFTFLATVYMENHPEKFGLVTTAVALGKVDVRSIKEAKGVKEKIGAVKEGVRQYHTAKKEIAGELRYIPGGKSQAVEEEMQGEQEYRKAA